MSEPAELPLEGLPPRLLKASPGRLSTWLDCPRRYRFTYLDRPPPPKGPPWAHNSFGATVHNALRDWVRGVRERRTTAEASRLVDLNWIGDGYRDDEQVGEHRAYARRMTTDYVETLDADAEPPGVERTVATKLPGIAFEGRVDRIDDRGDELAVVDYKTGRAPLDDGDARGSLQLALYVIAVERTLRRRCRTVELHHVPTGRVASFTHTDESLARHTTRAAAVADEIRGATDYPTRPGPLCRFCDFVRVCDDGRTYVAGRFAEPWSALWRPEGGR